MRILIFAFCVFVLCTAAAVAQQYDLVIEGGRVMDPETGLDAARNVGVRDGKIVRITSDGMSGRRVVRAGGLIVSPDLSICTSMDRTWRASE